MKKPEPKQAISDWPATQEAADDFMRGAVSRLAPHHQEMVGPLPQDFFWDVAGAIFDQIAETPALKNRLLTQTPITVLGKVSEVRADLESWAKLDPTGTVARAVEKGLAEQLAARLQAGRIAEYRAWRTAMQCGACAVFNESQALPGYQKAMDSVDAALRKLCGKHHATWGVWTLKMQFGTTFPSALLEYWLPLGLWALPMDDAIRSLGLFSQKAILSRFTTEEKGEFKHKKPELWAAFERSKLADFPSINRKLKSAFKVAVHGYELFRCKKSPAKLIRHTVQRPLEFVDLPYGKKRLQGKVPSENILEKRRRDPAMWEFIAVSGEPTKGRW